MGKFGVLKNEPKWVINSYTGQFSLSVKIYPCKIPALITETLTAQCKIVLKSGVIQAIKLRVIL